MKAPYRPLESCLEQVSLVFMNNRLVSFICPNCDKLVLDNPRVRLPKHIKHVCNVCGSKLPAEPFTYANLLAYLDIYLTDKGFFLSVPSAIVREPEMEVKKL